MTLSLRKWSELDFGTSLSRVVKYYCWLKCVMDERDEKDFSSQMSNLMVRTTMLSKYEENYLKRYFQTAELIAEFSVCLLRYSGYVWMYVTVNVKAIPVGGCASLQLLAACIKRRPNTVL